MVMASEDAQRNQRFMPGEGSIDLVGFLQALKEVGYADGVTSRLGRVAPEMSAEEAAKLGLETYDSGDEESRGPLTVGQTALAMVFGIAGVLEPGVSAARAASPPGRRVSRAGGGVKAVADRAVRAGRHRIRWL